MTSKDSTFDFQSKCDLLLLNTTAVEGDSSVPSIAWVTGYDVSDEVIMATVDLQLNKKHVKDHPTLGVLRLDYD
jgi:hypothetical protein